MGIVQSDLLIRVAILKTLEEVRKNPWLLDDILSDLTQDPLLAEVYGQKEIDNAKEWLENNKIDVLLKYRQDSMTYPCIGISLGGSKEDPAEATAADLSTEVDELTPGQICKPIPYMIKPFVPVSYVDGYILPPEDIDLITIRIGMLILDPDTGNAYAIDAIDSKGLHIKDAPNLDLKKCGIIPQHRVWRARRERASFREVYQISLHNHGDPAPLLWLYSIVMYGLLRYRETLFEARGLAISSLEATDVVSRGAEFAPAGENIYSRYITLSGLVQNSWLKSPKRVIEAAILAEKEGDSYNAGINIISNLDTDNEILVIDKPNWKTRKSVSINTASSKKKVITRK